LGDDDFGRLHQGFHAEEANRNHAQLQVELSVLDSLLIGRHREVTGEAAPTEGHEARALNGEDNLRGAATGRLGIRHQKRKQRVGLVDLDSDNRDHRATGDRRKLAAEPAAWHDAAIGQLDLRGGGESHLVVLQPLRGS
jgi:hypothetical protein